METLIVFDGSTYWLLTTRGMVQLMHPDTVNSFKNDGKVPQVTVDAGTLGNLKAVLTRAP